MKSISTIKIRNMNYKINITSNCIILDGYACYGLIDRDQLEIQINKNMPLEKQYETLWHEIVHGIIHEYNIDLNSDEENVIDEISKGIIQVLNDNPILVSRS